ncbi:gpW family head-tail joining protein [Bradyrhizobium neotropicale]|uniref:gpW family head-tail joining protein n=1 Tax=Bradyrhizobium neotropicale TaxID=1497615 RepID=UPI0009EDE490|nr:gpW family head-tail joining protein [Bradyrhizobium neotropicale]
MNNFNPSGGAVPADNPCALLAELRAAYHQLLAGKARQEVQFNGRRSVYHRADTKALQHEIRRLEVICESGINTGRAVRVGPYVPTGWPRRRY